MEDRYHQPSWARAVPRWSGLVFVIMIVLSIYWFQFSERWLFILVSVLGLLFDGIWLALFNDVIVCESGLKMQMFQFYWVSISWNNVMGVTDLCATPLIYRSLGYYAWALGGDTWKLLQVRGLTLFHRLACRVGVGDVRAGLLLPPQMYARDALVVKVKESIEKAGLK